MQTITTSEFTGSNPQPISLELQDYLVRFSKDETSAVWNFQMTKIDTLGLWDWYKEKNLELQTLNSLVHWQHKLLDYNSHYCAFLLGQVDEEEFEHISESFAYETKDVDPSVLTPLIDQIYKLTEIEYTPSDLAGFFECRTENVVSALKPLAIANHTFIKMLPAANQE